MRIFLLKAKLHCAVVTRVEPDYEGSCALDGQLLDRAGIIEHEQLEIYNLDNGERLVTYAIRADEPGLVSLNGAAAWRGKPGQRVIICSYCSLGQEEAARWKPTVLLLDGANKVRAVRGGPPPHPRD